MLLCGCCRCQKCPGGVSVSPWAGHIPREDLAPPVWRDRPGSWPLPCKLVLLPALEVVRHVQHTCDLPHQRAAASRLDTASPVHQCPAGCPDLQFALTLPVPVLCGILGSRFGYSRLFFTVALGLLAQLSICISTFKTLLLSLTFSCGFMS